MKTKDYMNELNAKSVDELQNELVAAKKELFNLRFQNATREHKQNQRCKKEYCKNTDSYSPEG